MSENRGLLEAAAEAAHQAANTGNGVTGVGAAWAIWGGLTLNDLGVIVGILGVILGTAITLIYKRKEVNLKREIAEKELAIKERQDERDRIEFERRMHSSYGTDWSRLS